MTEIAKALHNLVDILLRSDTLYNSASLNDDDVKTLEETKYNMSCLMEG